MPTENMTTAAPTVTENLTDDISADWTIRIREVNGGVHGLLKIFWRGLLEYDRVKSLTNLMSIPGCLLSKRHHPPARFLLLDLLQYQSTPPAQPPTEPFLARLTPIISNTNFHNSGNEYGDITKTKITLVSDCSSLCATRWNDNMYR